MPCTCRSRFDCERCNAADAGEPIYDESGLIVGEAGPIRSLEIIHAELRDARAELAQLRRLTDHYRRDSDQWKRAWKDEQRQRIRLEETLAKMRHVFGELLHK